MRITRGQLAFTLALLFAINLMNFYDRQVLGAVGERVKDEWKLSDTKLSILTTAFILLYAVVGLPLGRWADTGPRKYILAAGVIVWSVFTGLSGLAWGFESLVVFRLGVGVGEASCAPAGNSLIGDLFPSQQRARAISVFMLGLPIGLGASYILSGYIAEKIGWREALYVAAVPGLILGVLALWLPEPARGAADSHLGPTVQPEGSSILAVLRIPTMWWIIASGALLNLILYALGAFLMSFLIRFHGLSMKHAGLFSGVVYGFGGGLGLMLGGYLADRVAKNRLSGRMELAAVAMLISAPCMWLSLEQPKGAYWQFAALMFPGCVLLYVYYSTVYATIQDVVEPTRRGTAMAVYFFVFYLFAAAGLFAFGSLSDALAQQARIAGASDAESKAIGLKQAMYTIPAAGGLLVLVLWAGSRTVAGDHARLQERMRLRTE